MDNPEFRSKRKRENSLNVAPAVATKKRSTENSQPGTSLNAKETSAVASFVGTELTAGRDVNVYIAGGDLAVQEGSAILAELKALLKPVEAAYDSYVPSKNQRSRCFEGTRVQLLENIQKWVFGEGGQAPIYILDGVAGIGKTTVAQTVAELAAKFKILGASFFFSKDENDRNIAKYFFPTLAFHLACYSDSFATEIRKSLKNHPDAPEKALQQQISLLISKPLQDLLDQQDRPVVIVVDALDECDAQEAKILLTLLAQHTKVLPRLRIFITARPEVHIRDVLDQDHNHERFHLHDIEDVVVETDIQLFLDFCLSAEEVKRQLPRMDPPWQQTVENKRILYGICGKLFIIASTAAKFLLDTKRSDPERQLVRLLKGVSTIDFTGATRADAMDKVYMHILQSALPEDYDGDDDDDWFDRYQTVLGAIIVLQTPLPSEVLGALLGKNSSYIEGALEHLHSLVAPGGQGVVFRVHHKSFPDFITSEARIQQVFGVKEPPEGAKKVDPGLHFRIDARHHHSEMAKRCLGIMECHLRKNIFNIDPVDWYLDNKDIEEFRDIHVQDDLTYASLYWASHVQAGGLLDPDTGSILYKWATTHLLPWLELLSIIGRFETAYSSLEKVRTAVLGAADWAEKNHLHELFNDAYRFVRIHSTVIRLSALHMHWSAIPFVPHDTALYRLYGKQEALRVIAGIERTWDSTLAILTGHTDLVMSVVFSNDGLKLASASDDHSVRLWDALTGTHIITLYGHDGRVGALAFSNDGCKVASASCDSTVRIWDGITGTHIVTIEHSSPVASVAFSSDDSTLASASGFKVHFWNGRNGTPFGIINCSSKVNGVAFSDDGLRFALAALDDNGNAGIRLYEWDNKRILPTFISTVTEPANVSFIAFSNDSSQLASTPLEGTIQIHNAKTGTHIRTLEAGEEAINCISFSTSGQRLASSADRVIHIWDHQAGSHIASLSGHSSKVNSVAYSPDSTCIASCSDDHTVRIWDAQAIEPTENLHNHSDTVRAIAFSPDGSWYASASKSGQVNLWNGRMGDHIKTFEVGDDSCFLCAPVFSSDGTRLAATSQDDDVYLFDVPRYKRIEALTGHTSLVISLAFSSDNSKLATGTENGALWIWNIHTGEQISVLRAYNAKVHCIQFSPDGSLLAAASSNGTIRLYKAVNGAFHEDNVTILKGHNDVVESIAFSPDSTKLTSIACNDPMFLWETSSGVDLIRSFNDPEYQPISSIFSSQESNSSYDMFILFRRYEPYLSGIVHARLRRSPDPSSGEVGLGYEWDETPFLWFPPDLDVDTFSISRDGSHLAVGCLNGRVLLLDISQVTLLPLSP